MCLSFSNFFASCRARVLSYLVTVSHFLVQVQDICRSRPLREHHGPLPEHVHVCRRSQRSNGKEGLVTLAHSVIPFPRSELAPPLSLLVKTLTDGLSTQNPWRLLSNSFCGRICKFLALLRIPLWAPKPCQRWSFLLVWAVHTCITCKTAVT